MTSKKPENRGKTKNTSKFTRLYGRTLSSLAKELNISYQGVLYRHRKGMLEKYRLKDDSLAYYGLPMAQYRKLIKIYGNVNGRCNRFQTHRFHNYGGKGIKNELSITDMVALWKRDKADQLKTPSLDRKDTTKNYTLDNCRFVEFQDNRLGRWRCPNCTCSTCLSD